MMTKRIGIFLALVTVVSLLAACSSEDPTSTPTTTSPVEITSTSPAYPGPVSDDAYPGPAVESGYPAPEQPLPEETVNPEDVRFPGTIAFHSEQAGLGLQVYAFDGSEGSVTPLTGGVSQGYEPTWSPDCQTLIYTQQTGASDVNLYKKDLDAAEALPLFGLKLDAILTWSAAWSPKGDRIAYQTNPEASINVCFTDPDGNELGCLERVGFDNAEPAFSPNGEELVFISNRDGDWEIYSTNLSGNGDVRQLTFNNSADRNPTYSPDGQYIVFESNESGTYDIYRMRPDGSEITRLTTFVENAREPAWVGNDLIVFSSDEDGDFDLYLINAEGENLQQITNYLGKDGGAVWCP